MNLDSISTLSDLKHKGSVNKLSSLVLLF